VETGTTVRGHRPGTVSPAIPPQGVRIQVPGCWACLRPASWCSFKLFPGVLLWFGPEALRSGDQSTTLFRLPRLGQTVPSTHIVLSAPPGVFGWGKNIIPPQESLSGCKPPLNANVGATLTLEGLSVGLTSRCSSARTTSQVSSGIFPCSNANVRSSCQDEGTRLSGANSDFDNPTGDRG